MVSLYLLEQFFYIFLKPLLREFSCIFLYFFRVEIHLLEFLDCFVQCLRCLWREEYSRHTIHYRLKRSSLSIGDYRSSHSHCLDRYQPEVLFRREEKCFRTSHKSIFFLVRYAIFPLDIGL